MPDEPPRDAQGRRICGDPRARSGCCGSIVLMDNGKCRLHGGNAPRGAAAPGFIHGNRSKYGAFLPAQLRERYERLRADPDTGELAHERDLAALLLSEQLQRLGTGGEAAAVGAALLDSQELFNDLRQAYEDGESPRFRALLGKLETALAEGATAERQRRAAVEAEAEARKTLDVARKIADTQTRIITRKQAFVTFQQMATLVYRFADLAHQALAALAAGAVEAGLPAEKADMALRRASSSFAAQLQREMPVVN